MGYFNIFNLSICLGFLLGLLFGCDRLFRNRRNPYGSLIILSTISSVIIPTILVILLVCINLYINNPTQSFGIYIAIFIGIKISVYFIVTMWVVALLTKLIRHIPRQVIVQKSIADQ